MKFGEGSYGEKKWKNCKENSKNNTLSKLKHFSPAVKYLMSIKTNQRRIRIIFGMPSSLIGCMDVNVCLPKIKFEEKKGLCVIKENNITYVHVIITSSVHGIFRFFFNSLDLAGFPPIFN